MISDTVCVAAHADHHRPLGESAEFHEQGRIRPGRQAGFGTKAGAEQPPYWPRGRVRKRRSHLGRFVPGPPHCRGICPEPMRFQEPGARDAVLLLQHVFLSEIVRRLISNLRHGVQIMGISAINKSTWFRGECLARPGRLPKPRKRTSGGVKNYFIGRSDAHDLLCVEKCRIVRGIRSFWPLSIDSPPLVLLRPL
jgi:hypothetical protein